MLIKELNNKKEWEAFIAEAAPKTFLHSWNWGEVEQKLSREILRLGVFRESELIAVCLITKIHARRGSFFFCPHGPIFKKGADAAAVIRELSAYLRSLGKREGFDFIRISPLLKDSDENNAIFFKNGFRNAPVHMMHPELAWLLDLAPTEDALLLGMRKTTRYCVRKAEKEGIIVTQSADPNDMKKFWPVYEETVRRQQFAPFSQRTLLAEFEVMAQEDQARFFFAEYQGQIVAAAIIIFYGTGGFYHHAASSQKFANLNTTYLLQWRAIQEAKRRGMHFYNFWGVVPDTAARHPWFGLSQFKKGFGGLSESYVHAKDMPLSIKYWFSYIVETLRRIKRGL